MRILLISEDPAIPGGIPGYCLPLASALVERGHDVDYLFSGGHLRHYDMRFRRRWSVSVSGGVRYHGLVNPRSIGVHLGRPELDVHCDDSRVIARRARALRPDVVHVHSFLGIPVETLALVAPLAPVVLSVHEFGLLCQRRVLVRHDARACGSYRDQHECPSCVEGIDPFRFRARARLANSFGGLPLRAVHAIERTVHADVRVSGAPDTASPGNATAAPFRWRLARSVELVNAASSHVLAVSQSVKDILVEVGVAPGLVSVMHIGSGSAGRLQRLPLPCENGTPVTFLFLGGLVAHKGLHVLLEALRMLAPMPRLLVAGRGDPEYEGRLRAIAPPSVEFLGSYSSADLPGLLARADVVVAPTVGPDTSPQVVLESLAAGRPVIGSRVGGIPDFVRDGQNGILVEPGDAGELARALTHLSDARTAAKLAAHAQLPTPSLEAHARDLETLYASLV